MTGPGHWLTIASRGFSNYVSGHPLCVSFEITHACNASCDHCHRGGPVEENQATPEEFARIFQELRPSVIQVSGGEPLLRKDVKEVIRALQHPDGTPLTILVTNGSLLTPDLFRELHSLGVDAYSLSLDYPDDRHDAFRAIPGLFSHLQELIGSLTPAERCLVTLNCVIQSQNFRDLVPLAELAASWGVSMNYSPYTWMRTADRKYVVSGADLTELRSTVNELLEFKKRNNTVKTGAGFFRDMVTFFETGSIPGCRAGERFLVVNPDATLSPCGLITRDYPNQKALTRDFSDQNECTACNTSIRAWTERPFSMVFLQRIPWINSA